MDIKAKIKILIERPELAEIGLTDRINPNCFGTVAWILGIEKEVAELWRKKTGSDPYDTSDGLGNFVVHAPEFRRPGYIGHDIMDRYLIDKAKLVSPQSITAGNIFVARYSHRSHELCGFVLRHAGVMLTDGKMIEKEGADAEDKLRFDRTPKQWIATLSNHCYDIKTDFLRIS